MKKLNSPIQIKLRGNTSKKICGGGENNVQKPTNNTLGSRYY